MRMTLLFLAAVLAACDGGSSAATLASGITPVADVQGSGEESPVAGQIVTVEGVVTGDFQQRDDDETRNLGGFFIQDAGDGDPSTSDGVFIYDGDEPQVDVRPGDRVRVRGEASEFHGETQVVADGVEITGSGTVRAAQVMLPVGTTANGDGVPIAGLEAYEGMLVTFPQALTVSQLRNLERYGEVLLSADGRQFAYTNRHAPDVAGFRAHREAVAGRRVHLDDGLRTNNSGTPLPIRNGDTVSDLTGVLRYSRGSGDSGTETYRLLPTAAPQFTAANPRPAAPPKSGSLRVATFNVNNYFSTVDTGRSACGPGGQSSCRGADSAEELARQLAKIVTALQMIDADVVALVEVENNASASLASIVDALNRATSAGRYAFVDAGAIGDDAIKVGLVYQPSTVRPVGEFAILDRDVDVRFDDSRHRPVLAQTFQATDGGQRITVAANHLKSKSSDCDLVGDPDTGDGQGNCSATRSLGASAMADWLATDPTGSGSDHVIAIGDFNAYPMEDAIGRFEAAGYINLAADFIGAGAYSFEFDGQFGALDHAMASPSLAEHVVAVVEWHINADEAQFHDYNLDFGRDPGVFNGASPYRASDHDPLIVDIDFDN